MRRPAHPNPSRHAEMTAAFVKKLQAWFRANATDRQKGRGSGLPENPEQLAKRLSALGEHCRPGTARYWASGASLPSGIYVPHLERLMVAPWTYLVDPRAEWPPPPAHRAVYRILFREADLTAAEASAAAKALSALRASLSRGRAE